jgi:hypothetical protein
MVILEKTMASKQVSFLIQGKNIVVVVGGLPHTITESHSNYKEVKLALQNKDWDLLAEIVEPRKAIKKFSDGRVDILDDDTVLFDGKPFHNALAKRLIAMLNDKLPMEPIVRFIENLSENPSKSSVDELYLFLECNSLPLTPDGHFLAYKKIRANYTDCYTGKMDNSVGKVVEMPRGAVNANREETCSSGLHFCSYGYLSAFGGDRIVVLKINPRDVVSIPSDYSNQKGRACRYEVVSEIHLEQSGNLDEDVLSTQLVAEDIDDYEEDGEEIEMATTLDELTLPEKKALYNALVDRFGGGVEFTAKRFRDHDSANEKLCIFTDWQIDTVRSGSGMK